MKLDGDRSGDTLVIRVGERRIDSAVAIQFKDSVRDLAGAAGERGTEPAATVILDLARVDFVDSSGLGAIVAAMKLLAPAQRLELAALTPNVMRVFRLTRMDGVFTIHPVAPGAAGPDAA